ncbi:MAG: hypothetical protein Q7T27_16905 [Pseudomonas sp.]|nr:ABC-three component system protein [Pseudomonas sp.]MDO8405169.1 hypothetical protein [Pseudomonas sp.]
MVEMLFPRDVITGAASQTHPGLYVLGCYDKRITFYSQQVRALSLVHALHAEGYLSAPKRIAVIGAGAAGVTAAAALALITDSEVVLFERSHELMPIQKATLRRNIDPHIFDWPEWDTDDPLADLPILDWTAGPAQGVRNAVVSEFERMVGALSPRLKKRMRHRVTAINPERKSFELVFERDAEPGEVEDSVEDRDRYDIVFIAIGFGLEPTQTLVGIQNQSYWSDAGVPVPEFEGRTKPRFFISGNGDGALIDFVASASMDFDHARMIATITKHPGIEEIFDSLRAIDLRARGVEASGERFDLVAAYDAEVLSKLKALGLIQAVVGRLRPGVQLVLQTRHPEIFTAATSVLNRLAAYITMKACKARPQHSFEHIHCTDVRIVAPPEESPYEATHWLECNGMTVGAHSVIIRRGPNQTAVRAPFANVLSGFEEEHQTWLNLHGDSTLVPRLSTEARGFFESKAREMHIPSAPRAQMATAALPTDSIQIRPVHGGVRWSGSMAAPEVKAAWSNTGSQLHIFCTDDPSSYGPVATAIVRLATHASSCKIIADPARWRFFAERLSSESLHAEGLQLPEIEAGTSTAVNRNPVTVDPGELARTIHKVLDSWTLDAIDNHITEYLATGRDSGRRVGFTAAVTLRVRMRPIWLRWKASFDRDEVMRARFLRLLVCALDDDDSIELAHVLVGPAKLTSLVRGTTVALAIAAAWETLAPCDLAPGNLLRSRAGATSWTGHTCAADQVDGVAMSLCAARYMWQTQFVILSVRGSIDLAMRAEEAFSSTDQQQPNFTESFGSGQIIMSIDAALTKALETGPAELALLLDGIERAHFAQLIQKIEPQGEEHAYDVQEEKL